ncbi:hypothetical protein QAD02_024053 [Eretmocerus hayati]|uniref:Uncharacterized protein n=1 Tax=Eretmocerus hayati TaxID=131215 RepID=A0ACC2PZ99_9HYME|nr:hypothetical protein QAD02_024053 [Eretmocerus hayati]
MKEDDEASNPDSELSAVVGALLDTLNDKDETVKQSATESLNKISKKKPVVVLQASIYFWELHKKVPDAHKIAVLKIMTNICQKHIERLEDSIAQSIADLALVEIIGYASEQASELIVALSRSQCAQAVGALIIKFEPKIIPHHAVIRAIGMIAEANASGILPFIKVTLSVLIPILSDMADDQLKFASTYTLEKVSDAISDCLSNAEIITNSGMSKDIFFDELSTAFEILTNTWLRTSRNIVLTESILTAVASIVPLLSTNNNEAILVKLTVVSLNFCKKSKARLPAARIISWILNASNNELKEALRPHLDQMHQTLLENVSIAPFDIVREALLTHYEVLQCFRSIVLLYPEDGLDRILQYLKFQNSNQRSRALVVLRHLINTLPAEDELALQKIAQSIQDSLSDGNTRQVVGVIVALAARPNFFLLPSQRSSFIKFIVLHCGSKADEAEACEEALHLLSSTVEGAESWLWPSLIKALMDPSYAASATSILRALTPLSSKLIMRDDTDHQAPTTNDEINPENITIGSSNSSINTAADESMRNFAKTKLLVRCLELMAMSESNRSPVVGFLRCAAPLFGKQSKLKQQWESRLAELGRFLEQSCHVDMLDSERELIWEERVVEWLEASASIEGDQWALELADEIVTVCGRSTGMTSAGGNEMIPGHQSNGFGGGIGCSPTMAICLGAVAATENHVYLLLELARTHSVPNSTSQSSTVTTSSGEYARAVGICARRHPDLVLRVAEIMCGVEDAKKQPVRLLGLVRDTRAAASNEAAKAGLLHAYAQIASRAEPAKLSAAFDTHVLPWIVRQLNDAKEISTKEAGLIAVEQVGEVAHPHRLAEFAGFRSRSTALATILSLLQSSTGYRPLQLYSLILKAVISLIKVPPALTSEEKQVLLETTMDKVIAASSEIAGMKQLPPHTSQQVIDALSAISSEIILDSADSLATLVDILLPWMQSKSSPERRTTLMVLRSTLRSYHDSLKYTYPGGKLEPGRLLGRFLAWSADPDPTLRPLVIDCVTLALNIGARHRSNSTDSHSLTQELSESKRIIVSEDLKLLYEGVKNLSTAACKSVASGEIVSLAEGLVEALLYRGEGGIAAGISLTELFNLRGTDIPRSNLFIVDSIIGQMRQMDNASCKKGAAAAIVALSVHHSSEVLEHLLRQPLPLDRGSKECWRELGKSESVGPQILELLLHKLENENPLAEISGGNLTPGDSAKRSTACLSGLSSIVAMGQLLSTTKSEELIEHHLAELLAVLLKYLAAWLHVDPPMASASSKYGFVPNRDTCKISPYREAHAVLAKILNVVGVHDAADLPPDAGLQGVESDSEAEERLVVMVHSVVLSASRRPRVLSNVSSRLGKLVTSSLAAQRALAVAFYAELIGRLSEADVIWLDATVNSLLEAKSDSSPLVRKLATIGITRVACLQPKQVEEYLDSCLSALLEGLDEPSNAEGSSEVILESLRGLALLLSVETPRPMSPRLVLALKPFAEKDSNWQMRLAAISALGALAKGWRRHAARSPDDELTDQLLGCLPCFVIKLEDGNAAVAQASREVLCEIAHLVQCPNLSHVIQEHLAPQNKLSMEDFLRELIACLKEDLPQRAEELRNSVVRGYSRSENAVSRATSALVLGLLGEPRPEDIQRLLHLLHDQENFVRARAARALAICFAS